MDETRQSLTEKIEMLEQQVVDTVHGATSAVEETVGSVKEVVQDTVRTVKDSVQETVDTVKDTFDLQSQVRRRPWTMLAAAAAIGYVGGRLIPASRADRGWQWDTGTSRSFSPEPASFRETPSESYSPPARGTTNGIHRSATQTAEQPGLLASVEQTFHKEISQLKGLAVGALLGVVRDLVTASVPKPLEQQVSDLINGITTKLGGQPIQERLVSEEWVNETMGHGEPAGESCCETSSAEQLGSRAARRA